MFRAHVENLAKRGKKQVVPEGLYDALIAVVDLLQKMVRPHFVSCVPRVLQRLPSVWFSTLVVCVHVVYGKDDRVPCSHTV